MTLPIITTKLQIPPLRPNLTPRPHIWERLNTGLNGKLTLVSAPAGFGKTTAISEWLSAHLDPAHGEPATAAWLALDSEDGDEARFLHYLILACQRADPAFGQSVLVSLQSPNREASDELTSRLVNELALLERRLILVIDDYHRVDSLAVDKILERLVAHAPPQLHLVLLTREDPPLPLARLRVQGQLNELRAAHLRFSSDEASVFLINAVGLTLSAENIQALEKRTEGWIAGLQLAALSLRGHGDPDQFIDNFSGSNRFVLDYLMEEVFQQQPAALQRFLLHASLLTRFNASLCSTVAAIPESAAEQLLEEIDQANLFVVPLDHERHWYRFHHLFADLLRQIGMRNPLVDVTQAHIRASSWFEGQGDHIAAFQHAASAGDVARAEQLIEGKGMPLHFRGVLQPIRAWLQTLDASTLDSHPSLWQAFASVEMALGNLEPIDRLIISAESALTLHPDLINIDDLRGRNAALRATQALILGDVSTTVTQSEQALELLAASNLAFRTSTMWKLGYAYATQGKTRAAQAAYEQALRTAEHTNNTIFAISALIGLGNLLRGSGDLTGAEAYFNRAIELAGVLPVPIIGEAHRGIGAIKLAQGQLDEAQQAADRAVDFSQRLTRGPRLLFAKLLQVEVLAAQKQYAEARQLFVALDRDIQHSADAKLLSQLAQVRQTLDASLEADNPLVEPLSGRELEILSLVADGLSNKQIGERLHLAIDTVKGHNRNIFAKLQVRRRTEAVAKAREMSLL